MEIIIPGYRTISLEHLVFDYNGTIARDGRLMSNVGPTLIELAERFTIHILTADTRGTAASELQGLPVTVKILEGDDTASLKQNYVNSLDATRVAAIGNGNNDRQMLSAAAIGVAVLEGEGSSAAALASADIVARSIYDALGLFVIPERIVATLRN